MHCAGNRFVRANFTPTVDMVFGEAQIYAIIMYSILLAIGLSTNMAALIHLLNQRLRRRNRTRMTLLLIHLTVADLMVSTCHSVTPVFGLAQIPGSALCVALAQTPVIATRL